MGSGGASRTKNMTAREGHMPLTVGRAIPGTSGSLVDHRREATSQNVPLSGQSGGKRGESQ